MHTTALNIVKKLHAHGFKAYYAGGAVRDKLLKRAPEDIDIVTNALPEETELVLKESKIIPVGKEFGVLLVIEDGHSFEIATFRSDAGYSDGRRPDAVIFTSAEEDAKRRDFTINGMFYDPVTHAVLDYVGGKKDLDARLIRFIGDPNQRIKEDHLRILRAIRMKVKFDFQYHPDTYEAIIAHTSLIPKITPERIRDELHKMLCYPHRVEALHDLSETGALKYIAPELEAMKGVAQPYQYHKEGDVWTHTMRALASLSPRCPIEVIWAVLLHDSGKPETFKLGDRIRFDGHVVRSAEIATKLLTRLRYPNTFIEQVAWLCREHMLTGSIPAMPRAKQLKWFMHPWFSSLLRVARADAMGAIPVDLRLYRRIKSMYLEAKRSMPKSLPKLLAGEDIMTEFNLKPGKEIGELLEIVHDAQLEGTVLTKEDAIELIRTQLKN